MLPTTLINKPSVIKFIRDQNKGYRLESLSGTSLDNLAFLLIDEVECLKGAPSILNWLSSDCLVFNGNIIFLKKVGNEVMIEMDAFFEDAEVLVMDGRDFEKLLHVWLETCNKGVAEIYLEKDIKGVRLRS